MKLDYSSLSQPITQADVAAYKASKNQQAVKTQRWFFVGFVVIGLVVFFSIMLPTIINLFSGEVASLLPFSGWVALFAVIVVAALLYTRYVERRQAKLHRFALQNKIQHIEDQSNPGYTGMVFDEGHSRVIRNALKLQDGAEVGNYEYVTGSGKSRSTHTLGYVKIPLTRNLPHMVLDGKANNFLGFTGMTDSFDRSQKLSLEGDFDNYFTLYAPKEYERDALYVFTPDVMQVLIDEGKRFDMEIVDNELYVYSNATFDLISEKQLSSLMKIIQTVGSEIRDQTKRYADERVVGEQTNTVAASGRRLNRGVNWAILLILGVVVFNILISMLDTVHSPIGMAIYVGIGILIWVVAGVALISRIRLRK